MENNNLEARFFYRLVKVLYIFTLVISSSLFILILCHDTPSPTINDKESMITCYGIQKTSLKDADIFVGFYILKIDSFVDSEAKKWCFKSTSQPLDDQGIQAIAKETGLSYVDLIDWNRFSKNYQINIVYNPKDWSAYRSAVYLAVAYFVIFYILINLFRETLIYLAFGKKYTWDWLKCFYKGFKN